MLVFFCQAACGAEVPTDRCTLDSRYCIGAKKIYKIEDNKNLSKSSSFPAE
jgi:hypothetical protein